MAEAGDARTHTRPLLVCDEHNSYFFNGPVFQTTHSKQTTTQTTEYRCNSLIIEVSHTMHTTINITTKYKTHFNNNNGLLFDAIQLIDKNFRRALLTSSAKANKKLDRIVCVFAWNVWCRENTTERCHITCCVQLIEIHTRWQHQLLTTKQLWRF